jgi:hypothetical protein
VRATKSPTLNGKLGPASGQNPKETPELTFDARRDAKPRNHRSIVDVEGHTVAANLNEGIIKQVGLDIVCAHLFQHRFLAIVNAAEDPRLSRHVARYYQKVEE